MADTTTSEKTIIGRMTGMVKWFNNKSGFGFITVCSENDHKGTDIFVHYSTIKASSSQYKYLVQGEYVDFDLVTSDNNNHKFVASNVTGVHGGSIMCETRRNAIVQQQGDHQDHTYKVRDDNYTPVQRRHGTHESSQRSQSLPAATAGGGARAHSSRTNTSATPRGSSRSTL